MVVNNNNCREYEKMNDLHEPPKNPSEWIMSVKNMITPNMMGQFNGKDGAGRPIIVEWECIDPCSPRLSEKIKLLSGLLVEAYTKVELQFAQQNPDAIKNEMFLKSLESLLENGIEKIDWELAENKIRDNLKQFLTETDWTKFSNNDDIHLFALIKERETHIPLGMIQFLINSEYDYGNVKVALYDGVMPSEKERNLNKLLMSSIFKLIPSTKRIFLHTRITNENAINDHIDWGFEKFPGPLANWIDLEYKSEHSEVLQEMAKTLKE